MKKAKIKKQTQKEVIISEEYSFKSMIKILLTLVVIFSAFYLVTILLINPKEIQEKNPVVIDSSKIIMDQLFTRPNNEYYVLAIKESLYGSTYQNTNYTELYNNYIKKYKSKEGALPIYYIDLDDALNKKYNSEKLKISNEITKIELNNEVLFKVKDGKIEKKYIGKEEIINKLSKL